MGDKGTLYLRYLSTNSDSNFYLGTADRPLEIDVESGDQGSPGGWNDFNALIRLDDAILAHWDDEDFVSTNPEVRFEQLEWYEIWIVIRNTFEEVNGTWTSTGGYTIYLGSEQKVSR